MANPLDYENLAQTLPSLLSNAKSTNANRDAIVFPDRRLTYGELHARARFWAKVFIALNVPKGGHVGLLMATQMDFVEVLFGAAYAGAATVPINARYAPGELAYLIENADLCTLVTTDKLADASDFVSRMNEALPDLKNAPNLHNLSLQKAPKLKNVVVTGTGSYRGCVPSSSLEALAEQVSDAALDRRMSDIMPDDLALIMYTSGTTSNPKGCMISHSAMVSNSRALGRDRYQMTAADSFWSPLPIFHIAGILPMVAVFDVVGTYLTIRYFEPGTALKMLESEGATMAYPCFVTILQDLIAHESFATTDLSKIRVMNSNLGVQPEAVKRAIIEAMPDTIQVGTYGLTEASGTVCTSRLDDTEETRINRLGVPLDGWDLEIRNIETGQPCGVDEQGEILIRGPGMLSGYYKDPEKTAECIDADGWLHTGDIGSLDDDGQIMFHGRTKDMLKVGGENVAAAEIEDVINSHPAVELAQVVSAPDQRYVEVAAAFVKLNDNATATEMDLIDHCRGKLAKFKIPRYVRFVDDWPMSTSKIQKFKLKDDIAVEIEAGAQSLL